MFDIGGQVPLSIIGPLGGTLTVTVTAPDGTTSSPAVTANGTTFTASYTAAQAGRHVVTWAGVNPTVFAASDVFNVETQGGVALVSLAEVKSLLNITVATWDDDLRDFIAGATPVVEFYTGPVVPVSFDQWFDGGAPQIVLNNTPLVSVTSVTETFGANVVRTLTNQPLDGVTPVDAFGYTADLTTGTVTRRVSGMAAPFAMGRRNVHIVYRAGRLVVPPNIIEGTKELIRINWQPKQGGNRAGYVPAQGVDGINAQNAVRIGGMFVTDRVIQMLNPEQHAWGIA